MELADIFICLLSADFIASDYIWNSELSAIFKKLKDKNAEIIFVYLEPFDLESVKVANIKSDDSSTSNSILDFELIPKEGNHLKAISVWANENEALAEVAKKIRAVIEKDILTT
jgi:internalin A